MGKHLVLVTGGERSGKSGYAQRLALSLTVNPVYLATSRIWDEEFRQRVLRHQADRGLEWTNIEEEKYLSKHDVSGQVVVIDCVTLWGTNFFFANDSDVETSLQQLKEEFLCFTNQPACFLFVPTNWGWVACRWMRSNGSSPICKGGSTSSLPRKQTKSY